MVFVAAWIFMTTCCFALEFGDLFALEARLALVQHRARLRRSSLRVNASARESAPDAQLGSLRVLRDQAVCVPSNWTGRFFNDPAQCAEHVMNDARCSHQYFNHATEGDGDCGCVDVGVDCTLLGNLEQRQSTRTPIILYTVQLQSSHTEDVCDDTQERLTSEEVLYAKCPAGNISDANEASEIKEARLRKALCAAKRRGWRGGNPREEEHYSARGYATFESSVWPKDQKCRTLNDELWSQENRGIPYRGDAPKPFMKKLVNSSLNAEFRLNWKVASTTVAQYLQCEYGGSWMSLPSSDLTQPGAKIVGVVREPVSRMMSAFGEILERAINHWCPEHPCGPQDGFDPKAIVEHWEHMSTWYELVRPENGGYIKGMLPLLMTRLVSDAVCNYGGYAADHLTSQTTFLAGADSLPLAKVVKLEEFDAQLEELNRVIGKSGAVQCSLPSANDKANKPPGLPVPSTADMRAYLEAEPDLMQQVCLMYAQDFVCFDYDLPDACKGLF